MADSVTKERPSPEPEPEGLAPHRRLGLLVGTAVWLLIAGYLLPFAFRGWIPHDEGLLGQLGERALAGELPHIDFDDPYTGGLSWLYAGAFAVLGIQLTSLRIVLLLATLAAVPFFFAITRRFLSPLAAGMVTVTAFVWSVPNYFSGLPSWYNLLLAIPALWCLLKFRESGHHRWLLVAGFLAGLSTLVKISGLFMLAAGLLSVAAWALSAFDSPEARPPKDPRRKARGLAILTTIGGLALVALVCLLVQPLLAGARPTRALSVLGHFALPVAVLAGFLVARAWRLPGGTTGSATGGSAAPLTQIARDGGWLVAGWLLPMAALVAFYGAHDGLDDLWRGLFVMPRFRYQFAVVAPPPWFALLTLLPLMVLFTPNRFFGRLFGRFGGRTFRIGFAGVLALALGTVLVRGGVPTVHVYFWLPLRALVLLATVTGLLCLRRRSLRQTGLQAGVRLPASQADALFAVLATTAMVALIQVPTPYGIYFYYVAPLVVLSLAAVAACAPRAPRAALVVLLLFATAFPLMWLNGGHPFSVGYWRPYDPSDRLDVARGGIFVPTADAKRYEAVVALIQAHAPAGQPIWAAPDCPQIYFLSGRPNPTRTFFDFFAPTYANAQRLLANLDGLGIQVIVLNAKQGFSPAIQPEVLDQLAERYPNAQTIDHYTVRWRTEQRTPVGPLSPAVLSPGPGQ